MRDLTRNALLLLSILLAVFVPFVSSGYAELERAASAPTHLESAGHYQAAARRIPWRADLYELAGHYFYHAEEYTQAEDSYQKALDRNALSPDGWVACSGAPLAGAVAADAATWWQVRQVPAP